jgi:hypothetical protein
LAQIYRHSPADKSIPDGNQKERFGYSSRRPRWITISVSHGVHSALVEESLSEGRSLSNRSGFWLE